MSVPGRWSRVEALYHAARARGPEARAAFLAAECGGDAELRREVESLLAQPTSGDGFLGEPAVVVAAQMITKPGATVLTGRRIGAYQLQALLGSGGMGEVYRARDTKLGRDVAIKILPGVFTGDSERLARFEREARMLAALNHPHIGAIYGVEEADGVRALVLELVEGETLADRLRRGPVPVAEALAMARQIADALDAAHEKGIIHRDLKPANIKVTPDGVVKVLDFGLAKAATGDGSTPDLTQSPTVTVGGTREGIVLGTAAYMSPEQARGLPLDKRTDVWAFGCVLFEMLVGCAAFARETLSDTLAAILEREPDWSALPPHLPPAIRTLLARCVEKDRQRRVANMSIVQFVLDEPKIVGGVDRTARHVPLRRRVVTYAVVLLFGMVLAAFATSVAMRQMSPPGPQPARFAIVPPIAQRIQISTFDRDLAISPDGTRVVYVGGLGPRQLMVRALDRLDGVSLVALDDSRGIPFSAFISPDSQWVGFFDNLRDGSILKKVSIAGGAAIALCPIPGFARGGSWGPNGTIVFATDDRATGLLSVPAGGGDLKVLTKPDPAHGERDHLFPSVLPDGRGVLFTITTSQLQRENDQVAVLDLKSGQWKTLIRGASHAEYLDPPGGSGQTGYLVYAAAGSLRAVRFDLGRLEIIGDPVPVVDHVMTAVTGATDFAISKSGTLVYVPAAQTAQRSLVWVDREGREEPITAPRRAYAYPRLSPDGTRVAVDIRDQENDIWIWDLARKALTRLTFDRGVDDYPLWTPDGRRIIFESERSGIPNMFWQPADGSGNAEQLTAATSPTQPSPTSISPEGTHVVLEEFTSTSMLRLFEIGLFTPGRPSVALGAGQLHTNGLVQTDLDGRNGTFSPDGRWLAYQSNNTGQFGQFQVYVRPFPNVNAGRWQVSAGGGTRPVWARNGRELFFLDENTLLTSVTVQTSGASFSAGKPTKVLQTPYFSDGYVGRTYDVSADGRRFLMVKGDPTADQATPNMVVVLNWSEELKRLVPTTR